MVTMTDTQTLQETAVFLDQLANRLEGWATESRIGGWSTHQVDANRDAADDCRIKANQIRRQLRK